MGSDQLLADAATLMLLGMGTVFVFLTLLVYLTALMSALVTRFVPVAAEPQTPATAPAPASDDATLLAIITAAIHAHRSRR